MEIPDKVVEILAAFPVLVEQDASQFRTDFGNVLFADEKQNCQIRGGISKAYQNAELDVSFVDASGKTFKKIQEMPVVGLHVEIQAIPNGLVLDGFLFVNKAGDVFLDFLYIDGGDFCFFQAKQIFECAVLLFGKRLFENVKHEEKMVGHSADGLPVFDAKICQQAKCQDKNDDRDGRGKMVVPSVVYQHLVLLL